MLLTLFYRVLAVELLDIFICKRILILPRSTLKYTMRQFMWNVPLVKTWFHQLLKQNVEDYFKIVVRQLVSGMPSLEWAIHKAKLQ